MANVSTTFRGSPSQATTPTIYNLSMPAANTEYSQLLSDHTKRILIKSRDRTAQLRIAFVSGDTGVLWITIEPGSVYTEENLDLEGATIYLRSNKNTQTAEILEWK
jgi:hypothetical protein